MCFLQLLLTLMAVFAATTMPATADLVPSLPPFFEPLYFGGLEIGQEGMLKGPFGTRVNIPVHSLNLTDIAGNLVATLDSPSANTGVIDDSGIFFSEAVFAIRWEMDQKLAYFALNGVGKPFKSHLLYLHVETDSKIYESLNSEFLLAKVSFPEGEGGDNLVLTIFRGQVS